MVIDIANGLSRRGYNIDLILASNVGVYHSLLDDKIRLIDLGVNRMYQAVMPLRDYLHKSGPDTLFAIQRHAVIAAWLARLVSNWDGRLIARETNSFDKVTGRNESWRDLIISTLIKKIYHYVDLVIAPSSGIAKDLELLTNVHVIPNPVCMPPSNMSLQRNKPYVLGVGSLDNQKRFDDLIKAYAKFIELNHEGYDLIILGEGEERDKLMELAAVLGIENRLEMPGFVDDPFMYMREAAVFVLSSAWEGLPNVLLQAMACGAPVVATDCKHGPREILGDGKYGELVPVGDIDAMAAAMSRQACRGRVAYPAEALAPYDYETVLDSYQEILINKVPQ